MELYCILQRMYIVCTCTCVYVLIANLMVETAKVRTCTYMFVLVDQQLPGLQQVGRATPIPEAQAEPAASIATAHKADPDTISLSGEAPVKKKNIRKRTAIADSGCKFYVRTYVHVYTTLLPLPSPPLPSPPLPSPPLPSPPLPSLLPPPLSSPFSSTTRT